MVQIAASILSADLSDLGCQIKELENAGIDMIHIDIMDGHFVPNLTFGPALIKSIRQHTALPFDVHLMIANPESQIDAYASCKADIITVHPETVRHLDKVITQIKSYGIKAGVALLPTTSINILEYIIDKIDLILVMSVNPGFSGQDFLPGQLQKIFDISTMIKDKEIILAVDGGINDKTSKLCIQNGANMLVSGSYIFSGIYEEKIRSLR